LRTFSEAHQIANRAEVSSRAVEGSGTGSNWKNPSPRICAALTETVIEWLPAGRRKETWLISGSTTQMRGSSPHECPLRGTEGVEPTRAPKSSTSKESPARNPSVIVKSTAVGDAKIHGGVSRFTVPMPGRHGTPAGSSGWHPDAMGKWPGSKPNSYHTLG